MSDVTAGKMGAEKYSFVGDQLIKRLPNLKKIGIGLRESIRASHDSAQWHTL